MDVSQVVVQIEVVGSRTEVSQVVVQAEVVGSRTEVSQVVVQAEVDYHPDYGQLNETLGLGDTFSRSIETATVIPTDTIGLSDSFEAFRYTNYLNVIDNPHVGPIRIAKIELPGKTLYLCDRLWGNVGSECEYEDQLYEPLVLSWEDIRVGEINPVNYQTNPGNMSFVVDNNTPVGGADLFSELFATYDPYYTKVTVTEFFDADPPTDGVEIFEGYIEGTYVIADNAVSITCSGFELSISNKFSHDIVDVETYASSDPNDIGKMLPQVYGVAKRVPFRAVDIGAYSPIVSTINNAVTTITLTDSSDFPASGTVQIEDEQITYSGNTSNQLTGCSRGANSTSAAEHKAGETVVEVKSNYFYILGHAVKSITTVYVDNVRQEASAYTAYTGRSGSFHADYPGKACIAFTSVPTKDMGVVSADLEGWQDDAAGTYTGTANALIERPDSIIKHILLNRCGLTADAIDPTSYANAATDYINRETVEAVVITEKPDVRNLINDIARQAVSIEFWDSGAHNLVYLPLRTTVTETLDGNRIDVDTIQLSYTDRVDLLNDLTGLYDYRWSGYSGDDAYRASVTHSDTTSITDYGTLKGVKQYNYLANEVDACVALKWELINLKEPRLLISLTGGYFLTTLRRGNIINFDFTEGDNLSKALLGLVTATTDTFMILDIVRHHGSIDITAVKIVADSGSLVCVGPENSGIFYPTSSSDDRGVGNDSLLSPTASDCWIGYVGGSYDAIILFRDVEIPQGAVITSAYLKLYSHNPNSGDVPLLVYFVASDNPAMPSDDAAYVALSLTTGTEWNISDSWGYLEWYESDDISTSIQEVVDRGGFTSGNSVIAVIKDNGALNGRAIALFDSVSAIPELHVEWNSAY